MSHEFHEFASMFPLLEGSELDELAADIKTHGQREEIVMLDDKVLDGRNRYIACQRLKIKPRMRDFNCIDGDNPLDFVWSANFSRRHLTQSQRAIAIAKKSNFLEKSNIKAQTNVVRQLADQPISSKQAAKIVQVSPRTIERAKAVVRHGPPELIAAVEQGTVKLWNASEQVRKTTPPRKAGGSPPKIGRGSKVLGIPKGTSAEAVIREGLRLESEGVEVKAVLKKIGVREETYKRMREIVLISDRDDLLPQEKELAITALKHLNTHNQVSYYPDIAHISKRIWGARKRKDNGTEVSRVNEFEKKIDIVTHTCLMEIEIPQLSKERVEYTIDSLEQAIEGLRKLIKEIKDTYHV